MMIALHGEGLEAVLIEVSSANRAMVGVPPDGVSGSQPPKKIRYLLIGFWSDNKVPVIRHEAVGKYRKRKLGVSFS